MECIIFCDVSSRELLERYRLIVEENSNIEIDEDDVILYNNNYFYDLSEEWSVLEDNSGDSYSIDILLKMAQNNKLIYSYVNEDMIEGELVVIEKGKLVKKLYDYYYTPELSINSGIIEYEKQNKLEKWIDIGLYVEYLYEKLQE